MKTINIKTRTKLLPTLLSALLAPLMISSPALAQVQLLDQVAAVVDDDVVMLTELEERVEGIYTRLEREGTEIPARERIVPQVLERLIVERLQLNMGLRLGIRISDAELNQAIEQLAARQNLTVDQLTEKVHSDGIKLSQLRSQIRDEMTISRIQESRVNRRIRVTPQEVTNFLNSEEGRSVSSAEVNLGHIMLPLSAGASREQVATAQQQAADILEQLHSGADFKKLAVTSSGGQNALSGGDLGWRKTAQLPSVFIAAVSELQTGEVTAPLRSDAGLHVLKLYERRGGGEQMIQQSKVRHILIKPNEIRSDEDSKNKLLAIKQDVLDGADFAVLARENSEDIGSALSGGDLGWSLPGQFVPQFEKVMTETAVNEISAPFRSQFGWHMLQVTDRRDQDFSDKIKQQRVENLLRQRKYEEELQIWLQEIRDEAFVEIKLATN